MSEHRHESDPRVDALHHGVEELLTYLRRRETPAEPLPLRFDASQGIFELEDDKGVNPAMSYAIYNPVKARVYVALGSGSASEAGGAFAVPGRSFVVLPFPVYDTVKVGIDAGELGESAATIYRYKYAFVQPAFAMLL